MSIIKCPRAEEVYILLLHNHIFNTIQLYMYIHNVESVYNKYLDDESGVMVSAISGGCVRDAEEGASRVDGSQISLCRLHRDLPVRAGSQVGSESHRMPGGDRNSIAIASARK